jgi:hypothetical protein
MWLMRDAAAVPRRDVLAALGERPGDEAATVFIETATPRTRRSVRELIEAHAYAAHCQVAVAESRGIAVRWTDGIVRGTPEQLTQFLTTVRPVLDRSHGSASLAA